MAQVNSSPGQNQAEGNLSVVSASSSGGASDSQSKSNVIIVPYMQSEPGKAISTVNIKRS